MSQESYENICNFINECTRAIYNNDIESVKSLTGLQKSLKWCTFTNRNGKTLLQETIAHNRKDAFQFLLALHDQEDLEVRNLFGKTSLMVALSTNGLHLEYYVIELIKKGVSVDESCIHKATERGFIQVVELLVESGVDINTQDNTGKTPFHRLSPKRKTAEELMSFFLYHNANPLITDHKGCIPFEYIVKSSENAQLIESIFFYTFDKLTNVELSIETLVKLAMLRSPLFFELFNYKIRVVLGKFDDDSYLHYLLNELFEIDNSYLKTLIEKAGSVIKKLTSYNLKINSCDWICEKRCEIVADCKNLQNLNTFLETNDIANDMIYNIENLDSRLVFESAIVSNDKYEACQILTYLLSFGLKFGEKEYNLVYKNYGYCDLFKLMLHIGSDRSFSHKLIYRPGRFIYDVNFDIEQVFERKGIEPNKETARLLDYFSHPNLWDCLKQCDKKLYRQVKSKIYNNPKIPKLLELSRNVFRQFLVEKFNINSENRFYSMVNWLPISNVYKRIITYEQVLYT